MTLEGHCYIISSGSSGEVDLEANLEDLKSKFAASAGGEDVVETGHQSPRPTYVSGGEAGDRDPAEPLDQGRVQPSAGTSLSFGGHSASLPKYYGIDAGGVITEDIMRVRLAGMAETARVSFEGGRVKTSSKRKTSDPASKKSTEAGSSQSPAKRKKKKKKLGLEDLLAEEEARVEEGLKSPEVRRRKLVRVGGDGDDVAEDIQHTEPPFFDKEPPIFTTGVFSRPVSVAATEDTPFGVITGPESSGPQIDLPPPPPPPPKPSATQAASGYDNPLADPDPRDSPSPIRSPTVDPLRVGKQIPVSTGEGPSDPHKIYDPRWKVKRGSFLSDREVCHELLKYAVPPAECIYQRDRSRKDLLESHELNLAGLLATSAEITREWKELLRSQGDVGEVRARYEEKLRAEELARKRAEWERSTARADLEKALESHQKEREGWQSSWAKSNAAQEKLKLEKQELQGQLSSANRRCEEVERVLESSLNSKDAEMEELKQRIAVLENEQDHLRDDKLSLTQENNEYMEGLGWLFSEGIPRLFGAAVNSRQYGRLISGLLVSNKIAGKAEGFKEGYRYATEKIPAASHRLHGVDVAANVTAKSKEFETAKIDLIEEVKKLGEAPSYKAFKALLETAEAASPDDEAEEEEDDEDDEEDEDVEHIVVD